MLASFRMVRSQPFSFIVLLCYLVVSTSGARLQTRPLAQEFIPGQKQLLQEISQFLFDGANPAYSWQNTPNESIICIKLADGETYKFQLPYSTSTPRQITNAEKKQREHLAASLLINFLEDKSRYRYRIKTWKTSRDNRDNTPKRIHRYLLLESVRRKSVVVLVDCENVADFRRNFFTDKCGNIRFSSPPVPKLFSAPQVESTLRKSVINAGSDGISNTSDLKPLYRTSNPIAKAPSIFDDDDSTTTDSGLFRMASSFGGSPSLGDGDESNVSKAQPSSSSSSVQRRVGKGATIPSVDEMQNSNILTDESSATTDEAPNDDEILILAYAHTKSSQSEWANRLTSSSRKDAADALILFDLGALQLCTHVRKFILVTHDRFAENAKACFEESLTEKLDDHDLLQGIREEDDRWRQRDNNALGRIGIVNNGCNDTPERTDSSETTHPGSTAATDSTISAVDTKEFQQELTSKGTDSRNSAAAIQTSGNRGIDRPTFQWFETCSEVARLLGRLSL